MSEQAEGFSGHCLCGNVSYECSSAPLNFVFCHCRDCQYISGGGPGAVVVVPKAAVAITGDLKSFEKCGDSGSSVNRRFCPNCGTHLFSEPEKVPQVMVVKAGSMDDPSRLTPRAEIWMSSAQPWTAVHEDLPKLERDPP